MRVGNLSPRDGIYRMCAEVCFAVLTPSHISIGEQTCKYHRAFLGEEPWRIWLLKDWTQLVGRIFNSSVKQGDV